MTNLGNEDILNISQIKNKPNFAEICTLFDESYCENKSDSMELIDILSGVGIIKIDISTLFYDDEIMFPIHYMIANQSNCRNLQYIPNIMFGIYINYLIHRQEIIDKILSQYHPTDRDKLSRTLNMLPYMYFKCFLVQN